MSHSTTEHSTNGELGLSMFWVSIVNHAIERSSSGFFASSDRRKRVVVVGLFDTPHVLLPAIMLPRDFFTAWSKSVISARDHYVMVFEW